MNVKRKNVLAALIVMAEANEPAPTPSEILALLNSASEVISPVDALFTLAPRLLERSARKTPVTYTLNLARELSDMTDYEIRDRWPAAYQAVDFEVMRASDFVREDVLKILRAPSPQGGSV